jgi:hypothetical protein
MLAKPDLRRMIAESKVHDRIAIAGTGIRCVVRKPLSFTDYLSADPYCITSSRQEEGEESLTQ